MRRATAVIGAGFGDEGKGKLVDRLAAAAGPGTVVVRHNGGAQAAHTVVASDGTRHVFHHVGAGSLAGAATHLSRFFLVNPVLFRREWERLPVRPAVSVDPDAPVTTLWDMKLNQLAEQARGAGRHGSCGLGINETVERDSRGPRIRAADLHGGDLARRLIAVRDGWVPQRLVELGLTPGEADRRLIEGPVLLDGFLAEAARFAALVPIRSLSEACRDSVICEGAQGLLLDERHPFFPHVTRSRTGLDNALELGLEAIDVVYVIRAYMTRHGAGPFPSEDPGLAFEDPTNRPNEWQGALRFGDLDLDLVAPAIRRDLNRPAKLRPRLAITCLDQMAERIPVRSDGARRVLPRADFLDLVRARCGIPIGYLGTGPGREALTEMR